MRTIETVTRKHGVEITFNDRCRVVLTEPDTNLLMDCYLWYLLDVGEQDELRGVPFSDKQKLFDVARFLAEAHRLDWTVEEGIVAITRQQMQTLRRTVKYRIDILKEDEEADEQKRSRQLQALCLLYVEITDWLVAGAYELTYGAAELMRARKFIDEQQQEGNNPVS